ncbi:MAG: hypothetical protein WBG89_10060 [Ornithinimicrobium sp.]
MRPSYSRYATNASALIAAASMSIAMGGPAASAETKASDVRTQSSDSGGRPTEFVVPEQGLPDDTVEEHRDALQAYAVDQGFSDATCEALPAEGEFFTLTEGPAEGRENLVLVVTARIDGEGYTYEDGFGPVESRYYVAPVLNQDYAVRSEAGSLPLTEAILCSVDAPQTSPIGPPVETDVVRYTETLAINIDRVVAAIEVFLAPERV